MTSEYVDNSVTTIKKKTYKLLVYAYAIQINGSLP